jgi:hypothetical protein
MKFDLVTLVRRQKNPRRSRITLRPIIPTDALAANLYAAAYKPVVVAWRQAVERIGAAYERALPEQVKDSAISETFDTDGRTKQITDAIFDLDSILATIDQQLQQLVIAITPRLRHFAVAAETWHRGKFRGAVLAGTGIDPLTLLGPEDTGDTVSAFVSRNVQLVRSVSDEARGRISDIVLRGYAARTPLRTVAKEMDDAVELGRKRALRISSDQNSTLAARLDQARQEAAGITQFEWRSSHKLHARPWHAARDGKRYSWETRHEIDGPDEIPPGDGCGEPPWCGCRARAVIDLS